MTTKKEIIAYAVSMILKAVLLAAGWAGKSRKHGLESIAKMSIAENDKEIIFLRDCIYQLETRIKIFQKQYHSTSRNSRYFLKERLFILWHMEYFQIPRHQVTKTFGIARSTLYRWLKRIDDIPNLTPHHWNKTSESLVALVWRIANDNIDWGRVRISNQLKLLNIFLSASTVRNILQRPKPRSPSAITHSEKPKHLISDQGSVFTSAAFREFLDSYNVKIRYSAIGEHGSIVLFVLDFNGPIVA